MKTIALDVQIDANGHLSGKAPSEVPPGTVRAVLLLPEPGEPQPGESWLRAIAADWVDVLDDPREDIYTLEDGEPVDGPR